MIFNPPMTIDQFIRLLSVFPDDSYIDVAASPDRATITSPDGRWTS